MESFAAVAMEQTNQRPIERVEIVTSAKGGLRAYLHAPSTVSPEMIADIRGKIAEKGWAGVPHMVDGRPTLELRGFKKIEELQQFLQTNGWLKDGASLKDNVQKPASWGAKFRNATLKWTGISYNVGDLAFMTYAGMELHHAHKTTGSWSSEASKGGIYKILSGVGYALGSTVLTLYGSKDQAPNEIRNASSKINDFLRSQSLDMPEDTALRQAIKKHDRGFWGNLDALLRRFPSESLNLVYMGVGLLLMRSSVKALSGMRQSAAEAGKLVNGKIPFNTPEGIDYALEKLDVGLGVITATSAVTGLLVKEKKRPAEKDANDKPGNPLEAAWRWIEEKPLRATGIGYMLATLVHGTVTVGRLKHPLLKDRPGHEIIKKSMWARGIFVAANMVSEVLMMISSKGHGEGVKSADVDKTVIASTAEFIARQNPAMHEALVERLSGYMASPDVLGGRSEAIAASLREQLAGMKSNPWAQTAARVAQPASEAVPTQEPKRTSWQAHVAESKEAGNPLAIG